MKRWNIFIGLLALTLAMAAACGEKNTKETAARQAQMTAVGSKLAELQATTNDLRAKTDQLKTDQAALIGRLSDLQVSFDLLTKKAGELQAALNAFATSEADQKAAKSHGWPWWVVLILLVAIIALVYLVMKRIMRGEEPEEDDGGDEGFSEESDRGSVRYPGTKPPSEKKEKP
jgi:cell division protein FtsB